MLPFACTHDSKPEMLRASDTPAGAVGKLRHKVANATSLDGDYPVASGPISGAGQPGGHRGAGFCHRSGDRNRGKAQKPVCGDPNNFVMGTSAAILPLVGWDA
jgi:hypothetical protein